ncbi:MAG: DNA repair protein RecO [Vicinamibacteria bacterium]|nr:DNA repair protein RecO [Vicinamibacteria bacterium]
MPPLTTDALVLRTLPLGEMSVVAVLLTRSKGKVRAVAKGARGPGHRYQSSLQPLSEVRTTLYGREGTELFRLGAVELLRSSEPPNSNLESLLALEYCAELFEAFLPPEARDDDAYRLGRSCVTALKQRGPAGTAVMRYAEAWTLKLHGLYPSLSRCLACRQPITMGLCFDHTDARAVCSNCGSKRTEILDADSRALLRSALRLSPSNFALRTEGIDLTPIATFHRVLIESHLGRSLNSSRVIESVLRETVRPS